VSERAEPLFYELVGDVNKEINYLVLADRTSTSSKSEKAKKLGGHDFRRSIDCDTDLMN
jgi:hypothetical protein